MLKNVDLSLSMSKEEYKSRIDDLYIRIGELQRKAWKMKIPIIIVFEGWHASGMAEIINRCLLGLNPMGFRYHVTANQPIQSSKSLLFGGSGGIYLHMGALPSFAGGCSARLVKKYFTRKGKNDKSDNGVER